MLHPKRILPFLLFLFASINYSIAQDFGLPQYFFDEPDYMDYYDFQSADLNGDGQLDIFLHRLGSQATWLENNGEDFSESHSIKLDGAGFKSFDIADLDGWRIPEIIHITTTCSER